MRNFFQECYGIKLPFQLEERVLCLVKGMIWEISHVGCGNLYSEATLRIFKDGIDIAVTLENLSRIVHGSKHCREKSDGKQGLLLFFYSPPAILQILAFGTNSAPYDPIGTVQQSISIKTEDSVGYAQERTVTEQRGVA